MKTSLAAAALIPVSALAQPTATGAPSTTLPPVVITATRVETPPFDVPASVDRIDGEAIRDSKLQVNLSESVGGVPGLLARDRQNYAQDQQISVRGFGARATFGIRGVRVIVDGIPATLPDGQGQVSHIDLGSVDRLEILRGPFSALYGNSSGGVIEVFTEEGRGAPTVTLGAAGGSYGTVRAGAKLTGGTSAFGYVADVNRFVTEGYRDHSSAKRDIANFKVTSRPDDASKLTVVLNYMDLPKAEDPLGLPRDQFLAAPKTVVPQALIFNTRKTVDQFQLGTTYERDFGAPGTMRLMAYGGHRDTEQFQAIPPGPQGNPLHPGGVIQLERDYRGVDLRWTVKGAGERPWSVVAGLAYDELDEHRRGRQNFVGPVASPVELGVEGPLRRDEKNKARSNDQYVQGSWDLAPRWRVDAGVRHSTVKFRSRDQFIQGTNPDDSGDARYSATLPVAGVTFKATDNVRLYATAGRGFETPTLNEISYRPDGLTGLNFDVQPAYSNNVEAGVKTRYESVGLFNVALFQTRTKDEIVTLSNVVGRSTFRNAGETRRRGLEASWSKRLWGELQAQAAYTWLDARYREGFNGNTGNRIPGIARQSLFAAVGWLPATGLRGGVEARALSKVYTNDANDEWAPGFGVASAYVGYAARFAGLDWRAFARVDNLFDKHYAGSVIVNEGNRRYYEPAPGRNYLVGLNAAVSF
ncbi:MAG TPA: TonB-dependent receptor [Albitalea sp.]